MDRDDHTMRNLDLPEGCKDLIDAIRLQQASRLPPVADPPIRQTVELPAFVSVRFLQELSGLEPGPFMDVLWGFRIFVGFDRSVPFKDAARVLRQFGIAARESGLV
jgi:hypothetical protein